MMYLGRMSCLVLCLALGAVHGEAPTSPWPELTPTQKPAKQTFDQGQAMAQLAMTMEEELLVEMLPFKPPFKMDKKQMAVVIKLLKKLVKPVLKSERLRTMVSIVDDFMQELEHNQENKQYYIGMLNAAQDVYGEVNRMYNSEEAQGRTFETVQSIYRESVLNNYIVQPISNWIIEPITSRVYYAAERVYEMLPSNTWIVDTEYINPFASWGETFDYYVNRIANWSAGTRRALTATARMLQAQDEAEGRNCFECGGTYWGDSGSDGSDGSPGTDIQ